MSGPRLEALPLAMVEESPLNYRKRLDGILDGEFLASLRSQGQLTPGLVRPRYNGQGDVVSYELAAGARRRRGLLAIGADVMLCQVREMTDREFLEAMVTENLQRTDPHPLDEAAAYAQLAELGYDIPEIALRVGKSASYVHQRLKLGDLIPAAQKDFLEGKLLLGHALLLARRTAAQQEGLLARTVYDWRKQAIPVKDLEDRIDSDFHVSLSKAPFKLEDEQLVPAAGACLTCPKRSGTFPDLFTEVKGTNTCTDRQCHDGKVRAHVAQRVKAATEAGKELVTLSERYGDRTAPVRPGKALNHSQWREAQKGEAGAVQGIRVDGDAAGRTVSVILDVPKAGAPKKKPRAAPAQDTFAAREKRRQAIAVREVPIRRAIAEALLAKAGTAPVTPALMPYLLRGLFDWDRAGGTIGEVMPADLAVLLGVEKPKPAEALDAFGRMAGEARLWLAVLIDGELQEHWVDQPATTLLALAAEFGVDVDGIRAEWEAAHPEPKKEEKPAKAAAKKRSTKKKATKRLAGDARRAKAAKKKAAS